MSTGRLIGGRYRLAERLGRGSFGVVWRADELLNGEPVTQVAVKIFTADLNRDEIELLARMSHVNILGYRAVIEDDGEFCLVTELADGGDAAARLREWPDGMPSADVKEVLSAVVSALGHMHSQSWVHRDVKPANILFVHGIPKLGDVGTARMLTDTARSTSTASLAYAAPEMFSGRVSASVDVYALGCTAFELLTGRLPFEGSMTELVHMQLNQPVQVPADVPVELRALIEGCMIKEPEKRWSLTRVQEALNPPAARPEPRPQPTPKQTEPPEPPPKKTSQKPPRKQPDSATPVDAPIRRHIREHGARWSEAVPWRSFMGTSHRGGQCDGLN